MREKKRHFFYSKILAANETCPQPQTSEHLAAVDIMNLNSIIILQTKIDLMGETEAENHCKEIKKFIQSSIIFCFLINSK
jgi:translation initiation factor 2 subunit 3